MCWRICGMGVVGCVGSSGPKPCWAWALVRAVVRRAARMRVFKRMGGGLLQDSRGGGWGVHWRDESACCGEQRESEGLDGVPEDEEGAGCAGCGGFAGVCGAVV